MDVDTAGGVKRKEIEMAASSRGKILTENIQVDAMENMKRHLLDERFIPVEQQITSLAGKVETLEDQDDARI